MDYLTKYYKHLCEQLQEKLNIIEMQLNEAGVKKAMKTPSLVQKEILKGEARRQRTQEEMEDTDVSGAIQTYGASSQEAGKAMEAQDTLSRKIGKIDKNLNALEDVANKVHTTGSQQY